MLCPVRLLMRARRSAPIYGSKGRASLAEQWDGSWSATYSLTGHQEELTGVSCPASEECTASGITNRWTLGRDGSNVERRARGASKR